ncbi:hypothetical protein D3C87_1412170 [compost metagenome]
MNHVVELGHHQVFIADQRIVDGVALGFLDVTDPLVVVADRVDAQPEDLGVALVELWLEFGQIAQFSGANRSEILRMGKQDGPAITDPLVEIERAFGGLGSEIRSFVANTNCHNRSPCSSEQGRPRHAAGSQELIFAKQYRRAFMTRRRTAKSA